MIPEASEGMLLCVDSDFDYLFNGQTEQSELLLSSRFMFHTYTYATENYLCYAPSLHNVCVKATKNDTRIFDFERFMADYSRTIYRLFLWYAYSAKLSDEHMFTLNEFKSSVKIHYLDLEETEPIRSPGCSATWCAASSCSRVVSRSVRRSWMPLPGR